MGPFEGLDGLDGLDTQDSAFDERPAVVPGTAPYRSVATCNGGGDVWFGYWERGFEEGCWVWGKSGGHG